MVARPRIRKYPRPVKALFLMKGFLIEVKNDLLDPKHFEAMGIAVWLYMWLLDHVTKIDDDGKGWVLGGKPIKFEEVTAELGMSQDSYTRWIQTLVDYPYIEVTRTGYGIIFKILKAKKRFRKPMEPDSAEVRNQIPQKRGTSIRTSAESNKTVSVDSISKTSAKAENESENSEIQYETDEDFVPTRDLKKRQKPAKKMHKEIYELFPGYKPH